MALLSDTHVGLDLEYFPEIFQENKVANIPKNLQLGTQMAENLEVLEKWILADPQRDLTTTGLGGNFYCPCVQIMEQKWEIMGNILVPENHRFEKSTGQRRCQKKKKPNKKPKPI